MPTRPSSQHVVRMEVMFGHEGVANAGAKSMKSVYRVEIFIMVCEIERFEEGESGHLGHEQLFEQRYGHRTTCLCNARRLSLERMWC